MLLNDDEIEVETIGSIDDDGLRVLARLLIALSESEEDAHEAA